MRAPVSLAFRLIGILFLCTVLSALAVARRAADPAQAPGALGRGETLLPNGWRLAAAGRHFSIGDLPLGMVLSPDGRYAIVTNNGWAKPSLTIFDLEAEVVRQKQPLEHAWLGLAFHPDGKRLYSSGAAQNSIVELEYAGGQVRAPRVIPLGAPIGTPGAGTNRPL